MPTKRITQEEKRKKVMSERERELLRAMVAEIFANQQALLGMTTEEHAEAHETARNLIPFLEAQKREYESKQIFRDQIYSILGMNKPRLRRFLWGGLLFTLAGTFIGWRRAAELVASLFGG